MAPSFLGIYKAIYNYAPQTDQELALTEGDILYVLEKSTEDDWWKAKKRIVASDEEEPVGLIPNNYVEEVRLTFILETFLKPQRAHPLRNHCVGCTCRKVESALQLPAADG